MSESAFIKPRSGCYNERIDRRSHRSTDPILDADAGRLVASAALTAHVHRAVGGTVGVDSDAGDLLALARRLGDDGPAVEGRLGVRFEPPFPGATAGVEGAGGGRRLVLACTAHGPDDEPLHVLFTTLIPGRRPMVSAAPLGARVPENWRPIADLAPPR